MLDCAAFGVKVPFSINNQVTYGPTLIVCTTRIYAQVLLHMTFVVCHKNQRKSTMVKAARKMLLKQTQGLFHLSLKFPLFRGKSILRPHSLALRFKVRKRPNQVKDVTSLCVTSFASHFLRRTSMMKQKVHVHAFN